MEAKVFASGVEADNKARTAVCNKAGNIGKFCKSCQLGLDTIVRAVVLPKKPDIALDYLSRFVVFL